MDNNYHLQQGQLLLNKKDAISIKKALEHFRTANEMTSETEVGKPFTLYYLAYGNFFLGNIEQMYKIVNKAKKAITISRENCHIHIPIWPGEDKINELIEYANKNFSDLIEHINIDDDDFNENEIDFSNLKKLYPIETTEELKSQFTIDSIDEEILIATFTGLSRNDDQLIYFDKLKGDVLSNTQGYFSSLLGDQDQLGKILVEKIINNTPVDYIDENRYILIDRLPLIDFLEEYKAQTKNNIIFKSYVDYFSLEILKEINWNGIITLNDLACNFDIQENFKDIFIEKHKDNFSVLKEDYTKFFENTCLALSMKWINCNIFKNK
jgi:hypothetical protein